MNPALTPGSSRTAGQGTARERVRDGAHGSSTSRGVAVVLAPALAARGGAERVAVTIAATLRDAGYDTYLAAPGHAVHLNDIGSYLGVDLTSVRLLPLPAPCLPTTKVEVLELAEERLWKKHIGALHPDVFVNTLFGCEVPALAPVSAYYVHFPHTLDAQVDGAARQMYVGTMRRLRRVVNSRGRSFLDGYDRILANSHYTAGYVRHRWGRHADVVYPPCTVAESGEGAGTDRSEPTPNGAAGTERMPWILAVGRFQTHTPGKPHKQHHAMIDAFAPMSDLHERGWQLHLAGSVGSPQELAALQEKAAGLPVHFHPDATYDELHALNAMSSLYWHAQGYGEDLDAHPEAAEHFGITTVEALAAGLVPVVFAAGGPQEIIDGIPGARTWRTLDELRDTTRELADLAEGDLTGVREACRQRAHRFSERVFRRKITALVTGSGIVGVVPAGHRSAAVPHEPREEGR